MKKQIGLITFMNYRKDYGYIQTWENRYFFLFSNAKNIHNSCVVEFSIKDSNVPLSLQCEVKKEAYDVCPVASSSINEDAKDYLLVTFTNPLEFNKYYLQPINDYFIKLFNAKEYIDKTNIENILMNYKIILKEHSWNLMGGEGYAVELSYETVIKYKKPNIYFNEKYIYDDDDYLSSLLTYSESIWRNEGFTPSIKMLNEYKLDTENWNNLLAKQEIITNERIKYIRETYNKEEHLKKYTEQIIQTISNKIREKVCSNTGFLMCRYAITGVYV